MFSTQMNIAAILTRDNILVRTTATIPPCMLHQQLIFTNS